MITWLASYPRSGNTFTRAVLKHYFDIKSLSVYGDRLGAASNRQMRELTGHVDGDLSSFDLGAMRISPEIFFIKTHDMPCEYMDPSDRAIYIVRNGWNSCLSYLSYMHNIADLKDVLLQDVVAGQVGFGLWGKHVLDWRWANFGKIQFYKFEQIVLNPDAFADDLAHLLGLPRSENPFPDFSTFNAVNSNFFARGTLEADYDAASGDDRAIFEMFNGIGMRMAGYWEPAPSESELRAYSLLCRRLDLAKTLQSENSQLKSPIEKIGEENKKLLSSLRGFLTRPRF